LLTLWSEISAALAHEARRAHEPGVVVSMDSWRKEAAAQRPIPAPLYRMAAEGKTIAEPSQELRIELVRAVDELPPLERTVIALYYFEGVTLQQLKAVLNVSEARLSQIHTQAIVRVRRALSARLGLEGFSAAPASFTDVLERFGTLSLADESLAIRNGLSANVWQALQLLGFDRAEIARIIGTSEKTIHRKIAVSETLDIAEGDRTMRLIRIMVHAMNAFGDVDKALVWLRRSNRALEGRTPLDALVTEAGTALIRRSLGVIEYGGVA
jgi:putative toxin-antitoxin system antitoxin component (TIGR02293 family)